MNYTVKTSRIWILMISFSLVLLSCSNDPASTNDEEPPEFPTFESIEPDLSYFEENPPQKSSSENYNSGRSYAIGLGGVSFIAQSYLGFFSATDYDAADYDNGVWTWEYSYSHQGQSVNITLTAQESGNDILWAMDWSFDDGEGNSFENYRVLEGQTAMDGTSGSWTFNNLNPDTEQEEHLLLTNWTQESDTEVDITTEFYEEGSLESTYNYSQNGNEYIVSLAASDSNDNILVYWNTETMTGYYQIGNDESNRKCWDSSFQDVECS